MLANIYTLHISAEDIMSFSPEEYRNFLDKLIADGKPALKIQIAMDQFMIQNTPGQPKETVDIPRATERLREINVGDESSFDAWDQWSRQFLYTPVVPLGEFRTHSIGMTLDTPILGSEDDPENATGFLRLTVENHPSETSSSSPTPAKPPPSLTTPAPQLPSVVAELGEVCISTTGGYRRSMSDYVAVADFYDGSIWIVCNPTPYNILSERELISKPPPFAVPDVRFTAAKTNLSLSSFKPELEQQPLEFTWICEVGISRLMIEWVKPMAGFKA